jgi:hypothetical protein
MERERVPRPHVMIESGLETGKVYRMPYNVKEYEVYRRKI